MKRFTIICLLSTLVAFTASAQRYTDLEITLMSPNAGDTVWTKKQFDIGASIKNLGKDTVWSQDSIAFQLIFDGNPISFDFGNGFQDYIEMTGTDLYPGDSTIVNFSFTLGEGWPLGTTDICVKAWPLNTVDVMIDTIAANDSSCAGVVVAKKTTSVHDLSAGINEVKVYPVPAADFVNFDVVLKETSAIVITLTDLSGRVVKQEQANGRAGKNTWRIDTSLMPGGTYLYSISSGDNITRGKLQVQ